MKKRILVVAVTGLAAMAAVARFLEVHGMGSLVRQSTLVFVGRVRSVTPSGITTQLSYPTWEKVVFEWLRVDAEVVEPIKGTQLGARVQVAMLSAHMPDDPGFGIVNSPGMLEPKQNDLFLFCLTPTSRTNLFAAFTAPYDDNQAIFPLDRKDWHYDLYREGKEKPDSPFYNRHSAIWSLVDNGGRIVSTGADLMRSNLAAEIAAMPSNRVVYLQWQTETNAAGWMRDVPKAVIETNRYMK